MTNEKEALDDALIVVQSDELHPDWKEETTKFVQSIAPVTATLATAITSIALFTPMGAAMASMAALFATQGQRKKYQRLLNFVEHVRDETEALGESKLDEDYIGSEEHLDLLRETFNASAESRDDERVEWYAKILVGAASRDDRAEHDVEEYVHLLKSLTPKQVSVVAVIWDQLQNYRRYELLGDPPPTEVREAWLRKNIADTIDQDCVADLSFIFRRLKAVGFIECIFEDSSHYVAGMPVITDDFRRMMSFIEDMDIAEEEPPQDALSMTFEVIYREAAESGFTPIGVHNDIVPTLKENRLTEEDIVTSLQQLDSNMYVELSSRMGHDEFHSLSSVKPTSYGFDEFGTQMRSDWVDLPRKVATAVVRDGHHGLEEIAEAVDIPSGLVWHLLRRFRDDGKLLLAEDSSGVSVVHAKGPLRALAGADEEE